MPQPPRKVLKGIRTFDPKWLQKSFGMSWLKAASGGVHSFCDVCSTDLESRLDTLRDHGKSKGHINRMNNLNANKRMTAFITPKAGVYILCILIILSPPPPAGGWAKSCGGPPVYKKKKSFNP